MNKNRVQVLSIPYILWVIGFTVIPLIFVVAKAATNAEGDFTFEYLLAIFDPVHRKALLLSVCLAFISSVICVLISYPAAKISAFIQAIFFRAFIFVETI